MSDDLIELFGDDAEPLANYLSRRGNGRLF
jgi:hypothetical protein